MKDGERMSETPSIRISEHHQQQQPCSQRSPRHPTFSSAASAADPMAIPRAEDPAPPPLPPPSNIPELNVGQDPGWQWGQDSTDFGRPAAVRKGSSLLGAKPGRQDMDREHPPYDDARRASSISTITVNRDYEMQDGSLTPSDDGGRATANYRLQGERQLEQRTLENSSNNYDKHLLSRIGGPNGPNTPKRTSVSSIPASVQETAQLAHAESERWSGQLRPLAMPEHRQSLDSPARWPPSGAISPGFTGSFFENGPNEHSRNHSLASRHASLTFEDSISQRGSYDQAMFPPGITSEDSPMSRLHLQNRSPGSDDPHGARAGMKRRADSPPRDMTREQRMSVGSTSEPHEMYHRRSIQHIPSREGPVNRHHSSLSSASSYGPRHGSLGSSLGVVSMTSSATSFASGRASPSGLSPAFDPDLRISTPYHAVPTPNNVTQSNTSPRHRIASESGQGGQPEHASDSAPHSRNGSVANSQGAHACECCPKKPKKFDTIEELRMHESEKQYTCAYCPNRFKNKNEAERHQNSLHLRRHSWSCAVLAGVEAAFHASQTASGTDLCGYCGEEFANPPQWDVRAEHLNHVHKFGECNQAKKFFRADHFRQHLKHSHQGTSGKWTNQLEIACMKDEPLPEKRPVRGPGDPPTLMVDTSGVTSTGGS